MCKLFQWIVSSLELQWVWGRLDSERSICYQIIHVESCLNDKCDTSSCPLRRPLLLLLIQCALKLCKGSHSDHEGRKHLSPMEMSPTPTQLHFPLPPLLSHLHLLVLAIESLWHPTHSQCDTEAWFVQQKYSRTCVRSACDITVLQEQRVVFISRKWRPAGNRQPDSEHGWFYPWCRAKPWKPCVGRPPNQINRMN